MPIYVYRCPDCKDSLEVEEVRTIAKRDRLRPTCPLCKKRMKRVVVSAFVPQVWEPLFLEHASVEGMTFNSKKELQKWCKKEKVESSALL